MYVYMCMQMFVFTYVHLCTYTCANTYIYYYVSYHQVPCYREKVEALDHAPFTYENVSIPAHAYHPTPAYWDPAEGYIQVLYIYCEG